nr:CoA transferase [Marinicella sp. W31]MDC2876159.1 CoA transferase [Marinicella sp. W31]
MLRFAERLERIEHQDDLIEILTPVFKAETRDRWCEKLLEAGVPHAPAYDSDEALDDPQARHLQIAVDMDHPEKGKTTTVRAPYSFDEQVETDIAAPPLLDQHGAEIRAEIARRKAG